MIIGNGQLANIFQDCQKIDNICIFASGVSNSNCTDEKQFKREENLLIETLTSHSEKKFVYFSSSALSATEYPKNEYYKHKVNMEEIIKKSSKLYYIFRIPQLFGDMILHKTLINFIYNSIKHNHQFTVYDEAYRYVIEINDVRKLMEAYLVHYESSLIVNLANPYRYKVLDIVQIFEKLLDKKACYKLESKEDKYMLDLTSLENFIKEKNIDISFGEDYLINHLRGKVKW